jgi:hypothetical protein
MVEWLRRNAAKSLIGLIVFATVGAGWWSFSGKDDPSSAASSSGSNRLATLTERLAQRKQARQAEASETSAALLAVYARWDEAKRDLTGQALLDARQGIAKDAVMQLGGSDALLKFLDFLKKEGQGDLREWVITEGVKALFASPDKGPAAQEWLRGLQDAKVQESLCFAAGQGFKGPGFKEYLDTFASIHSQSRLLGGYFSEMAKTNPEGAIQAYFKAKPGRVDFTSLKHVMAAVPAGSDYTKIAGMVPGDSQSLAKSARKALLGIWAASAPTEAGDYILSNKAQVHPDQLGTVIEVWMVNDPEAARDWVEALDEGEHRDIAMASLSRQMIPGNPAEAWTVAMAIPDTKRREEAMKAVHQEWMKKDPKAADAAWKTMRGQKK